MISLPILRERLFRTKNPVINDIFSVEKSDLSCQACKIVVQDLDDYLTQVGTEQGVKKKKQYRGPSLDKASLGKASLGQASLGKPSLLERIKR